MQSNPIILHEFNQIRVTKHRVRQKYSLISVKLQLARYHRIYIYVFVEEKSKITTKKTKSKRREKVRQLVPN